MTDLLDAFRVQIFDKSVTLLSGTKNLKFSQAGSASATSFTIPSTLTFTPGNPYTIGFQLIDLCPGVTEADFLATNNNALILCISSSFFAFQILGGGAPPVVERPTVGPDPNPNDAFGTPYQFHVSVTDRQVRFIDPLLAIGYDYVIGAGDPNFASVIFPNVGDGLFELSFGGTTQTVAAEVEFFFPAGGVSELSVRGIETSADLDRGDVTAFTTGLTWVGLGEFTGTMTPVVQFVPEVNGVPFPGSLVLVGVGSWLSPGGRAAPGAELTAYGRGSHQAACVNCVGILYRSQTRDVTGEPNGLDQKHFHREAQSLHAAISEFSGRLHFESSF